MQTLYGPFDIRAWTTQSNLYGRFTLTGTGSDGLYEPTGDGTVIGLSVDAPQWTITFEASPDGATWWEYDPTRTTRSDPQDGLTIKFWVPPISAPGAMIYRTPLVVECTSKDPTLSPPPPPPPPDLTVPD